MFTPAEVNEPVAVAVQAQARMTWQPVALTDHDALLEPDLARALVRGEYKRQQSGAGGTWTWWTRLRLMGAARPRRGDGVLADRTALLVIDPVNDFLSEGGADWDMTRSTVEKHDVVGKLRRVIHGARQHRVPVLFGPMAFTAEDYGDAQLKRRSGINRMMFERRMFLAGSWGADFHPDLQPQQGDVVLLSHKGADVFQSDLPEPLERLGTTHLVIAGMTANLCCESTGRHAIERGYDVTWVGSDRLRNGPSSRSCRPGATSPVTSSCAAACGAASTSRWTRWRGCSTGAWS